MRNFNVMRTAVIGRGLYGAVVSAADPGINLNTQIANQKLGVHVGTGNPTVVAVRAQGPLLKANIKVRGQSSDCLVVLTQMAPDICVPVGPGGPVSPN